jgi:asparagine synthase (glutamine-hydrolysing)
MFAFAIWDTNAGKLFLARDRMGQKPLYVAVRDGAVAFASELPALRELAWPDTTLNPAALGHYLNWGYVPPAATIFTGVGKLPPATWLEARTSGVVTRRYFELPQPGAALPDDQAVAETRRLVGQSVRRQLVADVPLGCLLSGGIDSSVIAAAMKSAAPDGRVLTFSIGFDDPRYDESHYAAAVAAHLGTEHHAFTVRPDAAADLPKVLSVFGEPFADSSVLPTHYLAREARRHVTVALGGDGGDELFGGYDRYRAMAIGQRLLALPGTLRRFAVKAITAQHPKSRLTRLRRLLGSLDAAPAQRYASYLRLFDAAALEELLLPDLRAAASGDDAVVRAYAEALPASDVVRAALAADRALYLPEDLLAKVDRASMLHALEVRSPFMDHELVAFTTGLSADQLIGGGPKRMLREAYAPDLPTWVFRRRKMGFAVPLADWLRGDLRPMLHDLLFATDSFAASHFQPATVRRLADEHDRREADHAHRLYALLALELWHRGYAG